MIKLLTICIISVCALVGCGAPEETYDPEYGTAELDLTAKQFHGWRYEDGWDHHRCSIGVPSNVCMFPPRYQIDYAGLGSQPLWHAGATSAETIFESVSSFRFYPTSCGGGSEACLELIFESKTLPGPACGPNMQIHDAMNVACVDLTPLVEAYPASAYYCQQSRVGVDFAKLEAWFACRGMTMQQKAYARTQLMAHALGTAAGLGATDAGNTPMSLTVTPGFPQHTLQPGEITMLSTYNPNTLGFTVVP